MSKKDHTQLGPLMPPDFDHDYVTGAVVPFLNLAMYLGEACISLFLPNCQN